MSNIQFDEGNMGRIAHYRVSVQDEPKTSKMVSMLLKTGLVRDEKMANSVLLGIALLCTALAIWLTFFAASSSETAVENRISKDPSDMFIPQP